ncbi:MAG: ABC transporter permease [Betaproteobacteria bacterium]|nr:ABC transporter permease [Betaproteobacteria bacterium]
MRADVPPVAVPVLRRVRHGFLARMFRTKPLGALCGVVFLSALVCALFAGALAPHGVNEIAPLHRLEPPSWAFPFGTDNLGRDLLSRALHGARSSMIVALAAATLATLVSAILGIVSGYAGGAVDLVVQRVVDAWMTFPVLIVLIVVVSVLGPGLPQIIGTLGLLLGIGGSRVVRGAVVSVREHTYVLASRSIGASVLRILWRHILPNVMPPLIVLFTTRLGTAILAESGLAFLGLGVPPPTPTWGGMLSGSARTFMFQAPWLVLVPGVCLTIVVYAANMFGDALRDVLDPRMRGMP